MASNMDIYNALRQPPKTALRQIGGGKLKNFTDINPQWRYEAMTEQFGPCGIGWYYDIIRTWDKECSSGEVLVWMEIALYVKENGEWSMPIRGTGGNKIVNIEGGKLVPNDEGYKNAETDALSVAMKKIGMGADIYAGRWDGSKYKDIPAETPQKPQETAFKPQPISDMAKLKSKALDVVNEFDSLYEQGFIPEESYRNFHNAYDSCKVEDDYAELITRSSKNISDAKKLKEIESAKAMVEVENLF